ncbi:MAG: hypothetical protein H0T60_05055 [Acidobacteria bacterium]|nr:hypothetical protein [Acidobacteriota bacterium]
MRLVADKWRCEDGHTHTVVRADFNTDDINKATHIADQKVRHINVHSPGGIKRPPEVIHSRIIAGKLADYAVARLLRAKARERKVGVEISEYDEAREDDFRNPDPYDLRCSAAERVWDVEIRSSFSYKISNPRNIINKLSIYGWYVSRDKPAENPHDFYWQVIYHMRPQDVRVPAKPRFPWPDLPIFEQQLAAGSVTGFIIGGATRTMLEDANISTVREDQDNAKYQSVFPACAGMDIPAILQATLAGP